MVQIYFLLVVFNILAGLMLSGEFLESKLEAFKPFHDLISSEVFKATIGCLGTIVGFLSLFIVYEGNLIIVGDIIPAVVLIIAGLSLFIGYIVKEDFDGGSFYKWFNSIFIKNSTIVGIVAIFFGLVHFLVPFVNLV